MATIYLALGANTGQTKKQLDRAVELLTQKVNNIVESKRYRSNAVGYTAQAAFTNSVVTGTTTLRAAELLDFVKGIEQIVGRVERFRWGPREIDIDILFYDSLIVSEPKLTIPHPRFMERDFVLAPMCDLSPDFVDPLSGKTISDIYAELDGAKRSIIERH